MKYYLFILLFTFDLNCFPQDTLNNFVSNMEFNPYQIVIETCKDYFQDIIERRDLKDNFIFIVNIVNIDSTCKRIEFSIDYIRMDRELSQIKSVSYLIIDNKIALIKSENYKDLLLNIYGYPRQTEEILNQVKSELIDTSDPLVYVSYKGLTVAIEYIGGINKVTYYENEFDVPLKYKKYIYEVDSIKVTKFKTREILN